MKQTQNPNTRVMSAVDRVKHTDACQIGISTSVEDAIQNGVKETFLVEGTRIGIVENTIQKGVKNTQAGNGFIDFEVEDTIQNGVKETKHNLWDAGLAMEEVIQNGVKETTPGGYLGSVEMEGNMVHQFEHAKQLYYLEDVINDGIKEVKELPDKSGSLIGYGEYYACRENKTYPHTDIVNDVIRDGIKETKYCELHSLMRADHIIRDGVKETWGYEKQPQIRVNEVINVGIKETNWRKVDNHPTYVDNIIDKKTLL
jgi:hypothetical protein